MKKNNIARTFSTVFIITFVVKILGLLRDIVFAKFYGTGYVATAFFTSIRIPTQLVDIVLSSAIVSIFVPVFNQILKKDGKEKANTFAGNFINIIAVISTGMAILGILFAPQIVKILAGGFDEKTYALTVELVKITFPMIIFTSVAFSFVGFLQSYGEFNVPAMISGISNLTIISFLIFFEEKFGIKGVTYCMTFAWFLQVLIQIPFAKKYGYKFKMKLDFKDENVKNVFKLAIPVIISTAVLPINSLVSTRLASGMGESACAALEYAYKLYLVISGVFTYAIGNIIFPELSRASMEEEKFVAIIHKAIKMLSFLLIPLTLGIIIYRTDIIATIYQRGEFNQNSTIITASALLFYSIGIIGSGIVEIMNKAFYAKQDTKSPLKIGIVVIFINLFLSVLLGKFMSFNGLALATSISAITNAIILIIVASKTQKTLINKELITNVLKMFASAIIMEIVVYFTDAILKNILTGSFIKNIIRMVIGAGVGFVFYYILTMKLNVNELKIFKFKKGEASEED